MKLNRIYFPNLNGLRFIAAILVIIHHIELFKSISKIENYWESIPFVGIIGKLGVVLFFVLSGFLITYLLLAEEQTTKNISIRKFYVRRIIRIWPLYFLIIVLAFLVIPNIGIFTLPGYGKDVIYSNLKVKLILYTLFLPNLVLAKYGVLPYSGHTWSIGTEEQFYLVWPVLLKIFKKNRLFLMFFVIASYLIIGQLLNSQYSTIFPSQNALRALWSKFNIDCMAIGGIFAILLFQKNRTLKFLFNTTLFYATIVLVAILLINGVYIPYLHYEFYSVLFGIIILNFAANDKIKLNLENKIFNYLGNISYGLYMYHPIAIVLSIWICISINMTSNWLIYPLSLGISILIAGISYKYFESYFLKFKKRFSVIISGNKSKND